MHYSNSLHDLLVWYYWKPVSQAFKRCHHPEYIFRFPSSIFYNIEYKYSLQKDANYSSYHKLLPFDGHWQLPHKKGSSNLAYFPIWQVDKRHSFFVSKSIYSTGTQKLLSVNFSLFYIIL